MIKIKEKEIKIYINPTSNGRWDINGQIFGYKKIYTNCPTRMEAVIKLFELIDKQQHNESEKTKRLIRMDYRKYKRAVKVKKKNEGLTELLNKLELIVKDKS